MNSTVKTSERFSNSRGLQARVPFFPLPHPPPSTFLLSLSHFAWPKCENFALPEFCLSCSGTLVTQATLNSQAVGNKICFSGTSGGAVAQRSVRSFPERAVRVRALAGDIVLCSWARHLTLTVPLSSHEYKWVPANCWGNLTNCGEVTCDGLASCPGGVEILLAASCYGSQDKLWQHEPVMASRLFRHFS